MEDKEIKLIADNIEIIYDALRKGLIDNMNNIDVLKITEFDFEKGYMKLVMPKIEKHIPLKDILKLIKKDEKTV